MKRALVYLAVAVAILYAVRAIEYAGLRRMQGGEFAKLRTVFEEENHFDLVIIGSSRAECQFYNPIIDSSTGLHSYNLGMTGAVMPLIASTLEAYLVHSAPPKYVILNLDLHSPGDNTDTVYKFPRYFAFLDNEKLYEGLSERDGRFPFFRWLPFYSMPYFGNRYLSNSVRGWTQTPTDYDAEYVQGFAPSVPDTISGDLDTVRIKPVNASIPKAIWDGLERILVLCNDNHCKLIITVSPVFHRQEEAVTSYTSSLEAFKSFAMQKEIPFIDMGHDSLRFDKSRYADPAHLNKQGALEFTRKFSAQLKQYLGS